MVYAAQPFSRVYSYVKPTLQQMHLQFGILSVYTEGHKIDSTINVKLC